eukprot:XP_011415904.1 PREDICTED: cell wall protein DAN4-like [Crassostrea gigas]
MEISVTFTIFYIGIFYVHEIKAMTTTLWTTQPTSTSSETTEKLMTTQTELQTTTTKKSTSFSSTSSSTEITTTLPETTHSSTEEISTITTGKMTTPSEPTTSTTEKLTSTTEKLTSTTVTPTASTEKITTSTKVLPETTTSSTGKLTSTTPTPTTSTEKITSTENTSTDKPFVTQLSKSDKNDGVIAALGTIVGISLVANVLLSILLFRSCRRISNDNNTTPMYANENISKIDQTEMYTVLGNKEEGGTYQTLTHKNEVIYNNTNTCM